jgi:hypothetical protein
MKKINYPLAFVGSLQSCTLTIQTISLIMITISEVIEVTNLILQMILPQLLV